MPKRTMPATDDSDPLVKLLRGYVEDQMLRTGAVVEVTVYAPGTLIPMSEAIARNIDDFVVYVPEPDPEFEGAVTGFGRGVRDPWLAAE